MSKCTLIIQSDWSIGGFYVRYYCHIVIVIVNSELLSRTGHINGQMLVSCLHV